MSSKQEVSEALGWLYRWLIAGIKVDAIPIEKLIPQTIRRYNHPPLTVAQNRHLLNIARKCQVPGQTHRLRTV